VPVPDSACVSGELLALLPKESVVEALPLVCGANLSVMDKLCPAAMVTGKVSPVTENSEVVPPIELTVTLEPLALRVAV
jgi:hypothetical protein